MTLSEKPGEGSKYGRRFSACSIRAACSGDRSSLKGTSCNAYGCVWGSVSADLRDRAMERWSDLSDWRSPIYRSSAIGYRSISPPLNLFIARSLNRSIALSLIGLRRVRLSIHVALDVCMSSQSLMGASLSRQFPRTIGPRRASA